MLTTVGRIGVLLLTFCSAASGAEMAAEKSADSASKKTAQSKLEKAKSDQSKSEQAKPMPPDVKFLEYLGSLEGDGENWTEIAALALASPEDKPPKDESGAKSEAAAKSTAEKK